MNDCCDSSVAEPGARACETCAERGSPVQLQTVKALLTEVALRLLNAPARTQSGHRVYSAAVVHQVKFIKQAQSLGLTLDDIQQLAAGRMRTNHAPSCRRVRDLLTRRIEDIDARITELREFRRTLHEHLAVCDRALAGAAEPACPTIEALDEPKRTSRRHEAR